MDPEANLREQRTLAQLIVTTEACNGFARPQPQWLADANRLAELVLALDEWILNGGSLPQAWVR